MIPVALIFSLVIFHTWCQNVQEEHPNIIPDAQTCAKELNLTNVSMENFIVHDKFMEVLMGTKSIDRNEKCLLKCMLEKENYLNNDTTSVPGIDEEKCSGIVEEDGCELAYKVTMCIFDQVKKLSS